MQDPGYSYSAIAKKLSVGRTTVSTRIKALKDKGLIERIGSDKYGYWRIMD
ncbi:MAG: winged helix-turn-helix transcriptional regulator [Lachnospiraceae bacterium]|nr:winged helix-turn-helix transcriptional regulator [Lachnospiraceae bacterium]